VEVYLEPAINTKEKHMIKRSHIFLYPDLLRICESFTYAGFSRFYGDAWFNYMIQHDFFSRYYHNPDDYQLLINWINSYFEMYGILYETVGWNRTAMNYSVLPQTTLLSLDSIILHSEYSDVLDDAWINLKLANDYFESGDTLSAFKQVKRLKFLVFSKSYYEEGEPFHNMKLTIAEYLAINGKRDEAMRLAGQFSNIKNKITCYSKLAAFTRMNGFDSESEIYQDSALAAFKRVKFFRYNQGALGFDYRTGLVEMLTLQDNRSSNRQAQNLISAMEFDAKLYGVLARVRTLASMDQYFDARSSIPALANPEDRLRCINAILYAEVLKRADSTGIWSKFDKDLLGWLNFTEFLYDLFES
jgi:hypothetical protein